MVRYWAHWAGSPARALPPSTGSKPTPRTTAASIPHELNERDIRLLLKWNPSGENEGGGNSFPERWFMLFRGEPLPKRPRDPLPISPKGDGAALDGPGRTFPR